MEVGCRSDLFVIVMASVPDTIYEFTKPLRPLPHDCNRYTVLLSMQVMMLCVKYCLKTCSF